MIFDQKAWTPRGSPGGSPPLPHLEILSQLWQDSQIILRKNYDQNYIKLTTKYKNFYYYYS